MEIFWRVITIFLSLFTSYIVFLSVWICKTEFFNACFPAQPYRQTIANLLFDELILVAILIFIHLTRGFDIFAFLFGAPIFLFAAQLYGIVGDIRVLLWLRRSSKDISINTSDTGAFLQQKQAGQAPRQEPTT